MLVYYTGRKKTLKCKSKLFKQWRKTEKLIKAYELLMLAHEIISPKKLSIRLNLVYHNSTFS